MYLFWSDSPTSAWKKHYLAVSEQLQHRDPRCKEAASGAAADPHFSSLGMTGECRLTFCALCFFFLAPSFLFGADCSVLWFQWGRSVTLCPSLPWNACKSHWRAPSHSTGISQAAEKYVFFMHFSKHEILSSIIKMVFPPSFSFHVWPKRLMGVCSRQQRHENCRLPTKPFAFCISLDLSTSGNHSDLHWHLVMPELESDSV